jgi:hypothetical protein
MPDQSASLIPNERPAVRTRVLYEGGAWLLSVSTILLVGALIAAGGLFVYKRSLEVSRGDWEEQVSSQNAELRTELLDQLIVLSNSLAAARDLIGGHNSPSKAFQLLEETTHPKVHFTNFAFTNDSRKIDLTGLAASYETVAEQVGILEAHPKIEKVEFGGLSRGETGLVNFKLTLIFNSALVRASGD